MVGAVAAVAMAVVGCTSVIGGPPRANTADAPAYRSSIAASEVTSSIRETERQRAMTTQAVMGACDSFASSSRDTIAAVNKYVEAFNHDGDIAATASDAVDALNRSADDVSADVNDKLTAELKDAFSAYAEAARELANAISAKAPVPVYNARKDDLNRAREKGIQLCTDF